MRTTHLPLTLAAIVLTGGWLGGEHRPKGLKPDEAFTKADANNDGKLTLDEMKAALKLMPRPPRPEGKRDGKKDE
jgi:hypothetical protein